MFDFYYVYYTYFFTSLLSIWFMIVSCCQNRCDTYLTFTIVLFCFVRYLSSLQLRTYHHNNTHFPPYFYVIMFRSFSVLNARTDFLFVFFLNWRKNLVWKKRVTRMYGNVFETDNKPRRCLLAYFFKGIWYLFGIRLWYL